MITWDHDASPSDTATDAGLQEHGAPSTETTRKPHEELGVKGKRSLGLRRSPIRMQRNLCCRRSLLLHIVLPLLLAEVAAHTVGDRLIAHGHLPHRWTARRRSPLRASIASIGSLPADAVPVGDHP
ncbi:hypothetical protein BHE74_00018677 [Ensete ventricosum]|nr:hypothetical protein BHE74_00018677 [Ensete ventricosum]